MSGRLDFLDHLRAIAVLLVLVSHFGIAINGSMVEIQNSTINIGSIGVFIFFCVSGYVIPWSMQGKTGFVTAGEFWKRRILRLYPLYLLVATVGFLWLGDPVAVAQMGNAFAHHPAGYPLAFLSMTTFWLGAPTVFGGLEWTLAYEMVFYLACTAFLVGQQFASSRVLMTGIVILCTVVLAPGVPNVIQKAALMYSFFAFGFLFFLRERQSIPQRLFLVLAACVVATILLRNALWYFSWGVNYMTFACVPALIVFAGFASRRIVVRSKALQVTGMVSYSTYLTHIFVPHHIPLAGLPWGARFFVWTAVAIAVSVALYYGVERPFIRLGRRQFLRFSGDDAPKYSH